MAHCRRKKQALAAKNRRGAKDVYKTVVDFHGKDSAKSAESFMGQLDPETRYSNDYADKQTDRI